jgi:HTH-type transcriptional regulator, glycine betaine synthesis regulator
MSILVHLLLNESGAPATTENVPPSVAPVKVTSETRPAAPNPAWIRLEAEVIGLFVQVARIIGLPRSYAELYALLFMSPRTLTMDEMVQHLGISKGSASQGLNFLRKAGAIRMAHQPRRRPAQYEAVAELRHLAAGFLQDQILPQVEDSQDRLDQIARMVAKLPAQDRAEASRKITMLQSWGKQTRQFLPMVVEMMGA